MEHVAQFLTAMITYCPCSLNAIITFSTIVNPNFLQLLVMPFEKFSVIDKMEESSYMVVINMSDYPQINCFYFAENFLQFTFQPFCIAILGRFHFPSVHNNIMSIAIVIVKTDDNSIIILHW